MMNLVTFSAALFAGAGLLALAASGRLRRWFTGAFELEDERRLGVLDTLRAFAAFLVFFFHLWQWNAPALNVLGTAIPWVCLGDKGVPIFAAMSGFLIYGLCQRLRSLEDLGAFALRRVRRIYPLYAVSTILVALSLPYLPSLRSVISDLLMVTMLSGAPTNEVAWSVYVEEAFYAACPFVTALLLALRPRTRPMMLLLLVVATGILPVNPMRTTGLWLFFSVGMLAAEFRAQAAGRLAGPSFLLGIVAAAGDFAFPPAGASVRQYTGLLAAGLLGILYGGTASSVIDAALRWRPVRFLATISYSVYLLQALIVPGVLWEDRPWATVFVKTFAILGLSSIGYLAIERPFLRRRGIKKPAGAAPAGRDQGPNPVCCRRESLMLPGRLEAVKVAGSDPPASS